MTSTKSLWGKNLYTHRRDVYQNQAHFTIMFISCNYAAKLWASHESESAQARAFEESREYILPVRFDATDVPGILRTIGYIDLRTKSLSAVCDLILKKVEESRRRTERPKHVIVDGNHAQGEDHAILKLWFWEKAKGSSYFSILVDVSQYGLLDELLDDVFMHYLAEAVPPYTYGSSWLIMGEPFGTRVISPPELARHLGRPIHQIAP